MSERLEVSSFNQKTLTLSLLYSITVWSFSACDSEVRPHLPEVSDPVLDVDAGLQLDSEMNLDDSDPSPELPPQQIELTLGRLKGRVDETPYGPTLSFRGIPYAEPPQGRLRLKPPQVIAPWEDTLNAQEFGAICPQRGPLAPSDLPQSEDCLTLNLWTPADESAARVEAGPLRPVLVWIHGGGFLQGAGSYDLYHGGRLSARGDVVVVTFNYRLGLLGFLNTRRLMLPSESSRVIPRDEEPESLTQARYVSNLGLQDQLLALHWIRDHISSFGGDPERVTVFGESAGGFSICGLLASPLAVGLFQRAIIQSGGGCQGFPEITETEDKMFEALEALDCANVEGEALHECLETLEVDRFLDAVSATGTSALGLAQVGLVTDQVLVRGRADQLITDPEVPHPSILIGSNADEMTLFTFNQPITLEFYRRFLEVSFGWIFDPLLNLYPAQDDREARVAYNQLLSDLIFICPTLELATHLSEGGQSAWVYHFEHRLAQGAPALLGATHGLEIPFVFNNHHIELYGARSTAVDRELSDLMSDAWISFARHGQPEIEGLSWPMYRASLETESLANHLDLDEGYVLRWRVDPEVSDRPIREGRCQELKSLGF